LKAFGRDKWIETTSTIELWILKISKESIPVAPLKESGAHQKKKPLRKGLFFKI